MVMLRENKIPKKREKEKKKEGKNLEGIFYLFIFDSRYSI